jgi:ATP-dependent DNA helicase RecG
MSRLLEGDVGSGKTVVSAAAVYAVTKTSPKDHKFGRLQTAYMVPTEILAKQHFENFIKYFENTGVQIGLMTGSGCYKFPSKVSPTEATKISRAQLLKWIESGDIPILIGTHSLIQKTVKFKNLALVIIDEQHRFGTEQRKKLAQKEDFAPHLLSMTATPIPRTLALTIYGDLDLSIIDQMPLGRKPVITDIVLKNERDETYEKIRKEIKNGRQAYVICPRIDEPDPDKQNTLNVKSVKTEVKYLQEKFGGGFDFCQVTIFNILKFNSVRICPTLKILCIVPLIQIVASSFIFSLTKESHCLLNWFICSVPSDLSHFPLLTETIFPL